MAASDPQAGLSQTLTQQYLRSLVPQGHLPEDDDESNSTQTVVSMDDPVTMVAVPNAFNPDLHVSAELRQWAGERLRQAALDNHPPNPRADPTNGLSARGVNAIAKGKSGKVEGGKKKATITGPTPPRPEGAMPPSKPPPPPDKDGGGGKPGGDAGGGGAPPPRAKPVPVVVRSFGHMVRTLCNLFGAILAGDNQDDLSQTVAELAAGIMHHVQPAHDSAEPLSGPSWSTIFGSRLETELSLSMMELFEPGGIPSDMWGHSAAGTVGGVIQRLTVRDPMAIAASFGLRPGDMTLGKNNQTVLRAFNEAGVSVFEISPLTFNSAVRDTTAEMFDAYTRGVVNIQDEDYLKQVGANDLLTMRGNVTASDFGGYAAQTAIKAFVAPNVMIPLSVVHKRKELLVINDFDGLDDRIKELFLRTLTVYLQLAMAVPDSVIHVVFHDVPYDVSKTPGDNAFASSGRTSDGRITDMMGREFINVYEVLATLARTPYVQDSISTSEIRPAVAYSYNFLTFDETVEEMRKITVDIIEDELSRYMHAKHFKGGMLLKLSRDPITGLQMHNYYGYENMADSTLHSLAVTHTQDEIGESTGKILTNLNQLSTSRLKLTALMKLLSPGLPSSLTRVVEFWEDSTDHSGLTKDVIVQIMTGLKGPGVTNFPPFPVVSDASLTHRRTFESDEDN